MKTFFAIVSFIAVSLLMASITTFIIYGPTTAMLVMGGSSILILTILYNTKQR